METTRVDIAYRPLRIGWVIRQNDIEAFRRAVRLSYALWGGRFNPILIADRADEAERLVDLFRCDLIWSLSDSSEVRGFASRFPHLIKPFFGDALFMGSANDRWYAQILDVHNAVAYTHDRPQWQEIKHRGARVYTWQPDDPLKDVFLVQFGAYPSAEETGLDYQEMLMQASDATETAIGSGVIPEDHVAPGHPSIMFISRLGLRRHYAIDARWDHPGFFVGDATDVEVLITLSR